MNENKIELGDLAKDVITGFTGIVKYHSQYMHNCDAFGLQPQELKDSAPVKLDQFDAPNTVLVLKKAVAVIPAPRSIFAFGDVVADTLTDFKGTVVAVTYWISGCTRVGVQSAKLKDNKTVDWEWFPMGQLKLVKAAKKPQPKQGVPPGGPMPMSRSVQGSR